MRQLHETELEFLATLPDVPGYKILIEKMADAEALLREDMAKEGNARRLLDRTRFWQVFHAFVEGMRENPMYALQTLEENRKRYDDTAPSLGAILREKNTLDGMMG